MLVWSIAFTSFGQKNSVDFGSSSQVPYRAMVVIEDVDCETTQNIDIALPANFRYKLERVEAVIRTAPSAVTTAAKIGIAEWNGSTATEVRGDVSLYAATASQSDVVFDSRGSGGGYVYYQNIVAAGTTGLCTQNTALNVAGALSGEASPDVPRKLVITTVDNAGDNLAGTVTLTGLNVEGEQITEVVTIIAGTDSHTTTNVFATFTEGTVAITSTGTAFFEGSPIAVACPIFRVSTVA